MLEFMHYIITFSSRWFFFSHLLPFWSNETELRLCWSSITNLTKWTLFMGGVFLTQEKPNEMTRLSNWYLNFKLHKYKYDVPLGRMLYHPSSAFIMKKRHIKLHYILSFPQSILLYANIVWTWCIVNEYYSILQLFAFTL